MLIILAVTFLHHSYITHFSHIHHFGTIDINQVYNISLYLQFSFFVAVTTSQKKWLVRSQFPPFCSWLSPWYPAWFLHVSVDLPWDLLGSWVYTSWLVPWAFLSGPCSRNASTSDAAWSWPRWFSSLDGFRWVKCLKWGQLGICYLLFFILFLSSYNTTNMFYHIWLHYKPICWYGWYCGWLRNPAPVDRW